MHDGKIRWSDDTLSLWAWIDDTMGSFVQWPKANGTMAQWLDGTMAP